MTDKNTTQPVEAEESKQDAFKRLAIARVRKATKMIALIGNLSAPQYEATPEQIDKIEQALREQVDATVNRLRKVKVKAENFEL